MTDTEKRARLVVAGLLSALAIGITCGLLGLVLGPRECLDGKSWTLNEVRKSGCTSISGPLRLVGSGQAVLPRLELVFGNITVESTDLTLVSLPKLRLCDSLTVHGNNRLEALSLPALQSAGHVLLEDNDVLHTLELNASYAYSLSISSSAELRIVDLFLEATRDSITIESEAAEIRLSRLKDVGRDLELHVLGQLNVSSLRRVGGTLAVSEPRAPVLLPMLETACRSRASSRLQWT